MNRRIVILATTAALALMGLATATVKASVPTEIEVSPADRYVSGCPEVTANWTVYLWGGNSGKYTVTVHYNDGGVRTRYLSGGTSAWSHTFYIGPCSPFPDPEYDWQQVWSAWRSGGGTDYAYTEVHAN
jgi:hypothetical protein